MQSAKCRYTTISYLAAQGMTCYTTQSKASTIRSLSRLSRQARHKTQQNNYGNVNKLYLAAQGMACYTISNKAPIVRPLSYPIRRSCSEIQQHNSKNINKLCLAAQGMAYCDPRNKAVLYYSSIDECHSCESRNPDVSMVWIPHQSLP